MRVMAAATLLVLAACAEPAPPALAPGAFACPPAGSGVAYDDGARFTWRGSVAGDPMVCLASVTTPERQGVQARLYNLWPVSGAGAAEARAGLAALFPLREGARARFFHSSEEARRRVPVTVEEDWRVLRREAVTLGPVTRDAWVVERRVSFVNGGFRGEVTLWLDAEFGVMLKQDMGPTGGVWLGMDSTRAVALRLPRG